jgi:hypothetical protein
MFVMKRKSGSAYGKQWLNIFNALFLNLKKRLHKKKFNNQEKVT